MPYTTIQQISDALDLHTVQIAAAQSDADFAQSEAARALSTIYDTGLAANVYTDQQIQLAKDELRAEYQAADDAKDALLQAAIDSGITTNLPGLLNGYYGPYSSMQTLYDALVTRFDQSDASIDNLLNTVFPGLQSDVAAVTTLANNVDTNFTALEASLKSVLVVYAIDAAGNDQSLTAGSREYVQYVEYNGTPPTLPVTGTFIKFVGTPQSVWPIYAADAAGNNQGFEPLGREYVTFYESTVVPTLPVSGQTWVKYVGADGNNGERGPGVWWISVATLPTDSASAQAAWNAATEVSGAPKLRDQAWFYTGAQGNPTGQQVFTCQTVTDETNHTWNLQEHVMRGDLLVSGTVTANEIDAKGLTIYDEAGNVILAATGGSAGLDWSKVLGANKPQDNANYTTNTNQLTDGAGLGSTATWANVSGAGKPQDNANLTTNTNQLTDGAGLGQSAIWSSVTGSGKPDDNADVTASNTAASIFGQGAFATLSQITSGNAATFIANAAIGNALIGSLDAGKINTGLLNANRVSIDGITLSRSGSNLVINNGGVDTTQLALNSATVPGVDSRTTNYSVTGTWADAMYVGGINVGSSVPVLGVIFFEYTANSGGAGTPNFSVRLVRTGSVLDTWTVSGESGLFIRYFNDTPGSGTHAYYVQAVAGTGSGHTILADATLNVTGFKR